MSLNDFRSVLQALKKIEPDEIYNLAGQTSVAMSFEQPVETLESITFGTLNLLEATRFLGAPVRSYNACSGECFGDTGAYAADEDTPFRPSSPYAVAKAAAFWEVATYRQAYGLYACSGILFNHESPLRPERFVTKKIVVAACRIARGSREKLALANMEVQRDWGWAPEYVEAMWLMLRQEQPKDYVIATGCSHPLSAFVDVVFGRLGLSAHEHVVTDPSLLRPADFLMGRANPARAHENLGWNAKYRMEDVVKLMIEAEMQRMT